jgi:hypothetical protein
MRLGRHEPPINRRRAAMAKWARIARPGVAGIARLVHRGNSARDPAPAGALRVAMTPGARHDCWSSSEGAASLVSSRSPQSAGFVAKQSSRTARLLVVRSGHVCRRALGARFPGKSGSGGRHPGRVVLAQCASRFRNGVTVRRKLLWLGVAVSGSKWVMARSDASDDRGILVARARRRASRSTAGAEPVWKA